MKLPGARSTAQQYNTPLLVSQCALDVENSHRRLNKPNHDGPSRRELLYDGVGHAVP